MDASLPVEEVLPDLLNALESGTNAVLVASPGAGKTTRVPLALLDATWRGDGRILVLEPRRLAARAAARRMAATLGEKAGETIGYRMRMETKVSARTRIEVITEGVFSRMILNEPDLPGVAAVLFDEFHERSLDGDLGLALALDVQGALREDLRILVMSATLDAAKVAALLGHAPVVESKGRVFPVETRYLGRDTSRRMEQETVQAVRKALAEETGSILVFLPGQGEIRRVAEMIGERLPANVTVAPLYGALTGREQDTAIQPARDGMRKVVLATSIAQTSLTIEGVRIVIDTGLARVPRYEPSTGLTRLETVKVSRASADQRRGRAGRTEPGICFRLWDGAQTTALAEHDRPEILEADLAQLVLDLAQWGAREPDALAFLDPPPAGAWVEAKQLLTDLDALDGEGRVTHEGEMLARLPLHPRLAHMVHRAASEGRGRLATEIAVIVSERGLGGTSCDLRERLRRLRREGGAKAKEARALATQWLKRIDARPGDANQGDGEIEDAGRVLARAFPDRLAQARGAPGSFRLANGRGAQLEAADALAREPYLAVAEVQGSAQRARILLAAPISRGDIEEDFGSHIVTEDEVRLQSGSDAVSARRVRRLGKLVLNESRIEDPDPDLITGALLEVLRGRGVERLAWSKEQKRLRARVGYLHTNLGDPWPDLSDTALQASLDTWLAPYMAGARSLADIGADRLGQALGGLLPWEKMAEIDRLAPSHFEAPTGSRVPIDYGADPGPRISIRVQELFGLDRHPSVAGGRIPLVVELLSPAHRPIQLTRDLPGFWAGSWADVKADMKGRYPKHPWPDDPAAAQATRRAKPRT
ncbi:ATP-dependent helicase HrpB [Breoghania corrubedonensis]|uniref:ATP-dependent helicase HrpB n=1 Tax=Breoghania corrubedonensis TaxID=665038 RepID=A0A2T5VFL4_9HYPH|nr:ATP-dependent helicase HrpB [Breoghania corrubedonensis]PTW62516.1 ATP-dependent helicase HrpB [Breoghania corrubedonensis]